MSDPTPRLDAALAGRYRIERKLGEGGMATVYLADDLRHERKVALKVMKPELAAVVGAERFLAEIKTTANLQHPHILALHDSGEVDGTVFYVMPFVEGESLRDRLDREKQLPVQDAVRIAAEVASALEYAHGKSVIHRDIKPENILLHAGQALVADFGIALAAARTGSARMTETGMSLGTPHYMSPEQAMGERELDARSDVYALGCVLHEMLVGEPPFTGPTAQSIVAKVMTEDPTPPSKIRKTVPPHVEDAVLTALQKLPADRFGSAAEFRAALHADGRAGARGGASAHRAPVRAGGGLLWPVACALATGMAVWGWLRPTPPAAEGQPSRLAVLFPSLGGNATSLQRQVALTPDGGAVLFTGHAPDGENRTMYRALDETEASVLQGIEPFVSGYVISQDGSEFIGSLRESQRMFRYPINGGSPRALPRELSPTPSVAWDAVGGLWFSRPANPELGLARLGPDGQLTYPVASVDPGVVIAQILPGDRVALAERKPVGTSSGAVLLLDLETGQSTVLIDRPVVQVRYTAGLLVYVMQDGTMEAVPFDLSSLRIEGREVVVALGVSLTGSGVAQFDVSRNGTVAYIPEEPRSLVFVDREGAVRSATGEARNFHHPTFSPDGGRVSVDFNTADGRDVWLLSLEDGVLTRATFDRDGHDATWARDGETLIYTSAPDGQVGTYRTRPGSGEHELLFTSPQLAYTGVWLPDGSAIVTTGNSLVENGLSDIGVLRNGGQGPLEPFVASRFVEQYPAVSLDGRWVAYASGRSGRDEVYVRSIDGGDPTQVSISGGIEPVWGRDGREIFYRSGAGPESQLVAATVTTAPAFRVTGRNVLFSMAEATTATPHSNYDVSPDGRTFVMVRFNPASRIMVIQNLPALVRKLGGGA